MASDFELLHAWRQGDTSAGSELFRRHFDRLVRFFCNKVEESEYEDLIQRTMLACVESRDRFHGRSSFRTFLFSIARHQMLMHFRRKRTRPDLDFAVTSIAALGTSPSQAAAREQDKGLLLEALRQLPVDVQILIELHYWEDLSAGELAPMFDVDPTTIRTRLHRARSRLRETIEALEPDPSLRERAFGGLQTWERELHRDHGS